MDDVIEILTSQSSSEEEEGLLDDTSVDTLETSEDENSEEEESEEEDDSQSSEEEEQQQDNSVASDDVYRHTLREVVSGIINIYAIVISHAMSQAILLGHFNTIVFVLLTIRAIELFPRDPTGRRARKGTETLAQKRLRWMKQFISQYTFYKPGRHYYDALLGEVEGDADIDAAILTFLDNCVKRERRDVHMEKIEDRAREEEANGNYRIRSLMQAINGLTRNSTSLPALNNDADDEEEATTEEGSPAESLLETPISPSTDNVGGDKSEGLSSGSNSTVRPRHIMFSPLVENGEEKRDDSSVESTPRREVRRYLPVPHSPSTDETKEDWEDEEEEDDDR